MKPVPQVLICVCQPSEFELLFIEKLSNIGVISTSKKSEFYKICQAMTGIPEFLLSDPELAKDVYASHTYRSVKSKIYNFVNGFENLLLDRATDLIVRNSLYKPFTAFLCDKTSDFEEAFYFFRDKGIHCVTASIGFNLDLEIDFDFSYVSDVESLDQAFDEIHDWMRSMKEARQKF